MGRKSSTTAPADHPSVDRQALEHASDALTVLGARSAEVSERFGDGSPYERNRVVSEARFFMAQSAEAMLELGKRLIQIKENEPHGDFIEILEQRLGIGVRSAQLMMRAAVKYLSPRLEANANTFSHLGKAKLLELMAEQDDDLEALADGGTLAGLSLDEVEAMSVRELRAALAERDKKLEAKDRVIAKKDGQLNKLHEEAELRSGIGSDESATLQALRDGVLSAEIALAQFAATVGATLAGKPSMAIHTAGRQAGEYIAQRLADLLHQHDIPVSFEEMVQPEWLPAAQVHNEGKAARGRK